MNKKIFIYSDKVKSGKTTNLFRWMTKQDSVAGILQPVVEEKRFIYSIVDKNLIQLQIDEEQSKKLAEKELVRIGSYIFLRSGFEKAQQILKRDLEKYFKWLIVDEIGPLELNGDGLEPTFSEFLTTLHNIESNLVLVVRDKLLSEVIKKYNLEDKFELWKPALNDLQNLTENL